MHLAVVDGQGLAAPDQLSQILATLDIRADSLQPRLVGEVERERFDITDTGQNWFELDHERWTFRPIGDWSSLASLQVEDLVLDTRLSRENPELLRRVGTMYQFVTVIEGAQVAQRVPLDRATMRSQLTHRSNHSLQRFSYDFLVLPTASIRPERLDPTGFDITATGSGCCNQAQTASDSGRFRHVHCSC